MSTTQTPKAAGGSHSRVGLLIPKFPASTEHVCVTIREFAEIFEPRETITFAHVMLAVRPIMKTEMPKPGEPWRHVEAMQRQFSSLLMSKEDDIDLSPMITALQIKTAILIFSLPPAQAQTELDRINDSAINLMKLIPSQKTVVSSESLQVQPVAQQQPEHVVPAVAEQPVSETDSWPSDDQLNEAVAAAEADALSSSSETVDAAATMASISLQNSPAHQQEDPTRSFSIADTSNSARPTMRALACSSDSRPAPNLDSPPPSQFPVAPTSMGKRKRIDENDDDGYVDVVTERDSDFEDDSSCRSANADVSLAPVAAKMAEFMEASEELRPTAKRAHTVAGSTSVTTISQPNAAERISKLTGTKVIAISSISTSSTAVDNGKAKQTDVIICKKCDLSFADDKLYVYHQMTVHRKSGVCLHEKCSGFQRNQSGAGRAVYKTEVYVPRHLHRLHEDCTSACVECVQHASDIPSTACKTAFCEEWAKERKDPGRKRKDQVE